MQKSPKISILINLHKTQIQMDQKPQHESKYGEHDRRESEE